MYIFTVAAEVSELSIELEILRRANSSCCCSTYATMQRVTGNSYIAEHFPAQLLGHEIDCCGGGTIIDVRASLLLAAQPVLSVCGLFTHTHTHTDYNR